MDRDEQGRDVIAGGLSGLVRNVVRKTEDGWFDLSRSVQTSRTTSIDGMHLIGERRDAFMYMPCRARNVRIALQGLPVQAWSEYSFLDVGSGAGRLLFVASEFPFRRIRGIEFAAELHDLAERNIGRFRWPRARCRDIGSIYANAAEYALPDENLVLCMFNPFGEETTSYLVRNIDESIRSSPRDIFAMMFYPEFAHVMDRSSRLQLIQATSKFRIYRSRDGAGSLA